MPLFISRRNRGTRSGRSDVHPVDEVLPPGKLLAYGVQHIAAMYAGVVAPRSSSDRPWSSGRST